MKSLPPGNTPSLMEPYPKRQEIVLKSFPQEYAGHPIPMPWQSGKGSATGTLAGVLHRVHILTSQGRQTVPLPHGQHSRFQKLATHSHTGCTGGKVVS